MNQFTMKNLNFVTAVAGAFPVITKLPSRVSTDNVFRVASLLTRTGMTIDPLPHMSHVTVTELVPCTNEAAPETAFIVQSPGSGDMSM